jgi:hypothetical protein
MPRDDLEEALDKLYPHLRGTHRMHPALADRRRQAADEDDEEEVVAREAWDRREEKEIRELAERRETAEEVVGARVVVRSWNGECVREIARSLKVRQRVVLAYLLRFNKWGVEGLKGNGKGGRSGQTKAIVPASGKRSPFPLITVRFDILPFNTVEADGPGR